MPQDSILVHMTAADLLKIPFDGCNYLLNLAAERGQLTPSFIRALYDMEGQGKARNPVMNNLRAMLAKPPRVACAACDRGDFQLGHAEGCPKA